MARVLSNSNFRDDEIERRIRESLSADRISVWNEASSIYFALATALKASCVESPTELSAPYGLVVEDIFSVMGLSEGQRSNTVAMLVIEVDRYRATAALRCVDFLRIVAVRALLPIIRERAEGFFYKKHIPNDDIEDLGSELAERILRNLDKGKVPNGNAGAYYANACKWLLREYYRRRGRKREFVGDDGDAGNVARSSDRPGKRAIENLSIEELDPISRAIVTAWRRGDSLKEIAAALGVAVGQVRQTIRDYIEGP